jgi:hypothetical protein
MKSDRVTVLVGGVLATLLSLMVLTACGATPEPTATPGGSGPIQTQPKPSGQPAACLGDQGSIQTPPNSGPDTDGYIGLTQPEAKRYAAENDQTIRVAGRDGKCFPLTMDYRDNRVNLYLEDDVVIAATIG